MRITLNTRRLASAGLAALLVTAPALAQSASDPADLAGEIAALLDIASGEYALAVADGAVVDPLEYEETRLLLEEARQRAAALSGAGEAAVRLASALDNAAARIARVEAPAALEGVLDEARATLLEGWGVASLSVPGGRLSASRGADLYRAHCAACHGVDGRGDGPLAPSDPPPSDFTDRPLILDSSPARFFQVTSYGIPGTAMPEWRTQLDSDSRWDVVAFLARFGSSDKQRARGAEVFRDLSEVPPELADFERFSKLSGAELRTLVNNVPLTSGDVPRSDADKEALFAYARSLVEGGATLKNSPAQTAAEVMDNLKRALALHGEGDIVAAREVTLDAYMTFESLERELRGRAPGLASSLEGDFFRFRATLEGPDGELKDAFANLDAGLTTAVETLERQPSPWSDFFGSLVIIVREGVEAILIIGALLAFLVRSGHADQRSSIYAGVLAAIIASIATALVMTLIFEIAPARQELLEGVVMLIAVVVLFSVSYWLVSKIEVKHWQAYIRDKMSQALSTRSQLALAAVAFFAVYREGVETVLFYAALLGAAGSSSIVAGGFVAGLAILVVIYFGVYQLEMRIPLRPFFAVTSGILYLMAFVFAGRGVRELQEAGVVGITRVAGLPSLPALGIYPTLETLAVQGVLLLAFVAALLWTFVFAPVRRRELAAQ